MRDHGYDLSYNIRTNWATLGPKLRGKIHVYLGDMDDFYLNLAVYNLRGEKTLGNSITERKCSVMHGYIALLCSKVGTEISDWRQAMFETRCLKHALAL